MNLHEKMNAILKDPSQQMFIMKYIEPYEVHNNELYCNGEKIATCYGYIIDVFEYNEIFAPEMHICVQTTFYGLKELVVNTTNKDLLIKMISEKTKYTDYIFDNDAFYAGIFMLTRLYKAIELGLHLNARNLPLH